METLTKPELGLFPGVLSLWTKRAIELMRDGKPGDEITVDVMSQVIGRNCSTSGNGRHNVDSARNHCCSNYGVFWQWSRADRVWRCLDDTEKVGVVKGYTKRIHRAAGRTLKLAATVDESMLSQDVRSAHRLTTATAGILRLCSGKRFQKKLAENKNAHLTEPDVSRLIGVMTQ